MRASFLTVTSLLFPFLLQYSFWYRFRSFRKMIICMDQSARVVILRTMFGYGKERLEKQSTITFAFIIMAFLVQSA